MDMIEKRRGTLINLCFFGLVAAIYYFFMKYAFWLVAPFIFAFLIAMLLQNPIRVISKKTKIKKGIIGAVAVLLIISILVSALVLVGYRVVVEFKGFGQYIMHKIENLPQFISAAENWILDKITFLPDSVEKTATGAITDFVDQLLLALNTENPVAPVIPDGATLGGLDLSMLATPLGGLWSTAKQIPSILTAVLISIIACFFITCDYDNLTSMIKNNVSEAHEAAIVKTKRLFGDILGKMFKSYVTIIFITFCEISIGLNILKLIGVYNGGYILVISICTALLDILPVLGTGTVLVPWAIISLFTGNYGLGIGLLVVYALVTVIRQILEPHLVSMNVGLPPIVTLMGMYLGLQIFGVLGIFILPITFFLIKALNDEGIIHLWGRNTANKTE